MIVASVNPHWFSFARTLESTLPIKIKSTSIRNQHMLVKSLVTGHEALHDSSADATSLIFRQHQQMRIINHQMTVRNGIPEPNKLCAIPS